MFEHLNDVPDFEMKTYDQRAKELWLHNTVDNSCVHWKQMALLGHGVLRPQCILDNSFSMELRMP